MGAPAAGIQTSIANSIPFIQASVANQQVATYPFPTSGQIYKAASKQEVEYRNELVAELAIYSKTGQGFAGTIVSATIDPLNAAAATALSNLQNASPSDAQDYWTNLYAAYGAALEAVVAYYTGILIAA